MEGECLPRGYRVAWCDHIRACDVCYPIGIHLIARLIRRIWEWSVRYNPSKMELLLIEADRNGYARAQSQFKVDQSRINERAARDLTQWIEDRATEIANQRMESGSL